MNDNEFIDALETAPKEPLETEVEPQEEVTEIPSETRLFAGKYKTVSELEKAYANAESRLGDLGREVGELRSIVEDYTEQQVPQYPIVTEQSLEQFDEFAENRPDQAAYWALQNNPALYPRALQTWMEQDPVTALDFHTNLRLVGERQKLLEYIEPRIQPVQEQQYVEGLARQLASLAGGNPDVGTYFDSMLKLAEERPYLLAGLTNADPQKRMETLEDLYLLAKSRNPVEQASEPTKIEKVGFVEGATSRAPSSKKSNIDLFKEWMLSDPYSE